MAFYEDGGYYCYGCGSGGDGIALYAALHDLPQGEAARQLTEAFGLDGHTKPPPSPADLIREARQWRRREMDELHTLIASCNTQLDTITTNTPDWEAAWSTPGFTDAIRARELFERGLDELIYATNDELLQMMGGGGA